MNAPKVLIREGYIRERKMYKRQLGVAIKSPIKVTNKRKTQTKLVRDQTQSEAEFQKAVVSKLRSYEGLFIIYNTINITILLQLSSKSLQFYETAVKTL